MARTGRLLLAALVGVALLASPASAKTHRAARPKPVVAIVGDSVTSRYTNVAGDAMRGWWSWLAGRGGFTPVTLAQSGSGVINPGYVGSRRCAGTMFGQRTPAIAKLSPRPAAVIVEGGRNDLRDCSWSYLEPASAKDAYQRYYRGLLAAVTKAGLPASDVYVVSPWGTRDADRRQGWVDMQKAAAERYGFRWVETRALTDAEAPDGGHPGTEGSRVLAGLISNHSDLTTRFHS